MHYFIAYLRHLLTASNQHGVHSPFIYNFVTQGLYAKKPCTAKKRFNVLLKCFAYFDIKKYQIEPYDLQLANQIQQEFNLESTKEHPLDLIYLDSPRSDLLSIYADKIHNDSMILVGNIHHAKRASSIWKSLCQNDMVTVSIDMFYCGILFVRKEQAKEHFKIRI